jgi:hypothetical protein
VGSNDRRNRAIQGSSTATDLDAPPSVHPQGAHQLHELRKPGIVQRQDGVLGGMLSGGSTIMHAHLRRWTALARWTGIAVPRTSADFPLESPLATASRLNVLSNFRRLVVSDVLMGFILHDSAQSSVRHFYATPSCLLTRAVRLKG